MGLFDTLFGKANFHRFDDSYALDREGLQLAIHQAVQTQIDLNKVILVVVHFPATFEWLQDWFGTTDIEYQVALQPIDLNWVHESHKFAGKAIVLAISDLIVDNPDQQLKQPDEAKHELAMMVCERHPIIANDEKLEKFAKLLPIPTQLGYFISLQDPVVRLAISDTVVKVLQQMGMGEHELVTSAMVSKRLTKFFRREEKKHPGNQPADSQEEWLALNRPTSISS